MPKLGPNNPNLPDMRRPDAALTARAMLKRVRTFAYFRPIGDDGRQWRKCSDQYVGRNTYTNVWNPDGQLKTLRGWDEVLVDPQDVF